MDYEQGKRQMLPQARATALSVRGVTRLAAPHPEAGSPAEGRLEAVWLWVDADVRPDLKRFWSLHGAAGGGTSETWWLSDIDDAPAVPPCLYLLCRLTLSTSAQAMFLLRFPLPDLAWVLDHIDKAPLVGLSVSPVPAELGTLHGLSEAVPLAVERIPQVLRSSVIIDELSKGDLRRYLQRWRSSGGGPESGTSSGGSTH
jgi:hypothetical protein